MSEKAENDTKTLSPAVVRKSLRARTGAFKQRSHGTNSGKGSVSKSRSRKNVLKKHPNKLCPATPLIRMELSVCHKNTRFNVGDIVSVVDVDGGIYYAQIRGLAVDAVGDSCCVLTWLIPIVDSPVGSFQPENFVIGMEEDVLRDIDCCNLVCRCPADYFRPVGSPYSIQSY